MAGLGLTQALQGYQQGVQWRQQQDQLEQEKKRRDSVNVASLAGAEVLKQAQQQHEAQQAAALDSWMQSKGTKEGFQGTPFKPDESLYIRAIDARGNALAASGQWDDWLKNEAVAMPLRERVRTNTIGKALQQYDQDQDPVALAKTVYPTIYDGKDITGVNVDKTGGLGFKAASGLATAGKPVPEQRFSFTLSDGTRTHPMTQAELVDKVKWAQLNPGEVRKYEMEQRVAAAKRAAEAEATRAKEAARGEEDRKTETTKHGFRMDEIGLQNQGRQDVAETRADATVTAAAKRGAGGSGGGKGTNVQSVQTDNDGYKVIVFRDGSTKRLAIDGKPVRGETWSKRVDSLAKQLGGSPDGFRKSAEELRAQAETMLIGKAVPSEDAPAAPAPKPAAKAAPKFLGFEN